jgi:hypothetical protein
MQQASSCAADACEQDPTAARLPDTTLRRDEALGVDSESVAASV